MKSMWVSSLIVPHSNSFQLADSSQHFPLSCYQPKFVVSIIVIYAKKPSFSPFFFANRINPWICFWSTPICLQKSFITWECKDIAFPRILLKSLVPIIFLATLTNGAKGPFEPGFPATTTKLRLSLLWPSAEYKPEYKNYILHPLTQTYQIALMQLL